jgi:hypothetical protein
MSLNQNNSLEPNLTGFVEWVEALHHHRRSACPHSCENAAPSVTLEKKFGMWLLIMLTEKDRNEL